MNMIICGDVVHTSERLWASKARFLIADHVSAGSLRLDTRFSTAASSPFSPHGFIRETSNASGSECDDWPASVSIGKSNYDGMRTDKRLKNNRITMSIPMHLRFTTSLAWFLVGPPAARTCLPPWRNLSFQSWKVAGDTLCLRHSSAADMLVVKKLHHNAGLLLRTTSLAHALPAGLPSP